jgi:hypothetical protein
MTIPQLCWMSLWPTFCTRISRRWVTRQRTLWLITDWCQAVLTVQYWWVCDRLSARGSQEGESPDKGLYDSSLIDVKQFLQYSIDESVTDFLHEDLKKVSHQTKDSMTHHWWMSSSSYSTVLTIMKLTFCTRISRRWVTRKRTLWLITNCCQQFLQYWWKWCSFSAWGSQEGESPEKELYDSTLIDIKQLLLTIMKLTFCTRISRRWVTRKRTLWLFPDKIKMLTLCWPMNGGRRWILKV